MCQEVYERFKEYQNQKPKTNEGHKIEKSYTSEGTQSQQVLDKLNKQSSLDLLENIYADMKTSTSKNN